MSAWNCMDEGRRMEHQQPCMGARIYSCIAWWLRSYLAPLPLPGKFVASLVTIPQLCEEDLKLIPNQPRSCVGREQNWLYCEHSMSVLKHEIALWVYPKLANVLDKYVWSHAHILLTFDYAHCIAYTIEIFSWDSMNQSATTTKTNNTSTSNIPVSARFGF